MPPRLHKILRLELPFADAMDIVLQAVQAIPADIDKVDDQKGSLAAKTHQSLKSRGENIHVQVEALDKGGCQVRIDSELMWILTESQLDWGVNTHNIEEFEKAVDQGVRKWEKARKTATAQPDTAVQSAPATVHNQPAGLVQMQCSACGAKLTRQPEAGHWVCIYCGHEYFEKT
jgi:hypothetical protein